MEDHVHDHELFYRDFKELSASLQSSGKLAVLSGEFAKLKTDIERISFVRKIDEVISKFNLESIPHIGKSATKSDNLRNEGNKFFKNGKYEEALSLYNDSVAYAPHQPDSASGRNNLALAFSNRSAALIYLNEYDHCLQDIQNAIHAGYPEGLQYKLYDRRGKCHNALKSNIAAQEAFETAMSSLEKAKLDNKKKNSILQDLKKNIKDCTEKQSIKDDQGSMKDDEKKEIPSLYKGANCTYTSLSSACKVAYTPNQGRFLVADRVIDPGEVLLVERPYASVLLPDQYSNHCHHCFKRCISPMVCIQCPIARYCTVLCRNLAWGHYHKHECVSLDIIHRSGVGKFGHLALRTISISGLESLLQNLKENLASDVNQCKEYAGCNADGLYLADNYNAIIHLVTHDNDRSVSDLFRRSAIAVFLTKCLDRANFFQGILIDDLEDVMTYIGSLLLSHLQLMPCNAHEISELELDKTSVASSVPTEVGAGIYSTLSLFNHSCNPAVTRSFYGGICVVRAIRTIRCGEEVSDNYGAVYAVQSSLERHEKLSPQYYFQCSCEACNNNWPLYPHIEHQTPTFKCEKCLKPLPKILKDECCPGCLRVQSLTEKKAQLEASSNAYQAAFENLLSGDVPEALPIFLNHIKVIDELLILPWREYNNCQEAIKQCYSIMGNCHIIKAAKI